ncbi:hypothetical protein PTSG_03753 [Salpingoeca rosetta]|uniref:Uncharacterized protein n=1 Tax=Salpingoeca rosetta (strain ATCC 50818 / BSB-021) TaxID=946362 RepID=F2U6H3_SALR5|nr:uncharacterized protein PTSG_03753 [Salpingoeca rosetta]EGD83114.1 hypothetical protein PTSG_03753 [Salpingoeca rosetta]|eukprot:XP_004995478.1 hypothetical protein PTSG_03753 [Salpingoeca rosetta]
MGWSSLRLRRRAGYSDVDAGKSSSATSSKRTVSTHRSSHDERHEDAMSSVSSSSSSSACSSASSSPGEGVGKHASKVKQSLARLAPFASHTTTQRLTSGHRQRFYGTF